MTEPLIFQGTVDQWEDAADYVPLLSALEDRRTYLRFGVFLTLALLVLPLADLAQGLSSQAFTMTALALLVGVVCWRRVTGRSALRTVASNRRVRQRGQEKGRYNGSARFRLELARGEIRLVDQGSGRENVMDCRLIHKAVECGEVIWLSGWSKFSVALPKRQLVNGTGEDLRAWLKPYAKEWKTVEIPEKWMERLNKITKKG